MSSSRSVFADGFSADTSPERHSQILKRFNDLRNRDSRNMFFERPFGSDWSENRSFSRASCENDSVPLSSKSATIDIPIQVVHQKNSSDEMNDSSKSSALGNNGKQHEARIEPRIHHVPIKVEARDDTEPVLSRSSSNSSQRSAASSASGNTNNSAAASSSEPVGSPNAAKEHIVPITVENDVKPVTKKVGSPLPSKPIKPKMVPPVPGQSQSTRQKNVIPTPNISRVYVSQREEDDRSQSPSLPPKQEQAHVKPDPLALVAAINKEIEELEKKIETFCGAYQDKTYLYLDEMLTRCLLKLDNIEINGRDDVRQARKSAISFINRCITSLENKAKQLMTPEVKNDCETTEEPTQSMEVDDKNGIDALPNANSGEETKE